MPRATPSVALAAAALLAGTLSAPAAHADDRPWRIALEGAAGFHPMERWPGPFIQVGSAVGELGLSAQFQSWLGLHVGRTTTRVRLPLVLRQLHLDVATTALLLGVSVRHPLSESWTALARADLELIESTFTYDDGPVGGLSQQVDALGLHVRAGLEAVLLRLGPVDLSFQALLGFAPRGDLVFDSVGIEGAEDQVRPLNLGSIDPTRATVTLVLRLAY